MQSQQICDRIMAVSCSPTSSFQNFDDAVHYALSQLGMSHLSLKSEQRESIMGIYDKKDVFMFLPTGFGKSICFQALPFVFDHKLGLVGGKKRSCVIVVSPLIALMVDQVRSLRRSGVEAVVFSSSSRERSIIDKEFIATDGNMRGASLIFSSPEALAHPKWREVLEDPLLCDRVCAIVVDEAHCVSKW